MGLIADLANQVSAVVKNHLTEVALIHDATKLRPALAAGKTVVWIGPPETITYDGYHQGQAFYEIAILSPKSNEPTTGLDDAVTHAQTLQEALGVERITPDSLTIGNGPAYPAVLVTFTLTFQET